MGYDPDDLMKEGRESHRTNGRNVMRSAGGKLTAGERDALPSDDFALPGRRYPIQDRSHAANAKARVSQFGSSKEKAEVRAKVHAKYPDMGEED